MKIGGVKRKRSIYGLTVAFLLLSAVLPALVAAQVNSGEGLNLTTSPLPINLVTKPGTTVSAELRVKNSGVKTENLKIDLYKFRAYGDSGKPQILDREPGDSYFDWVSFSQSKFSAEPNVWKTIKMTINLPPSAAFGYYYAVVFARADKPTVSADRTTAVIGGSATLVLLEARVPGAKRQVEVSSFTADKKFYDFLPATFRVSLRNSGQVHVAPSGTIFLMRGGHQVASLSLNRDRGNILPASSRAFETSWNDGFPVYTERVENGKVVLDKQGRAEKQLKWDLSKISKLRIGHYTARLVMIYDDGTRDVPIEGSLAFWVVPWKLLLLVLAIFSLAAFGLWSIGRSIWRRFHKTKA